jgi:hypothetical protein
MHGMPGTPTVHMSLSLGGLSWTRQHAQLNDKSDLTGAQNH